MKMRKVVAGLLATAMVISGVNIAPNTAEAAASTDIVTTSYEVAEEEFNTVSDLLGKNAPSNKPDGDYLFGGWYADSDCTVPVKSESELEAVRDYDLGDADGNAYAKWVPASVLGIKAQNVAGVKEDSEKANMRLITSVDSLDYKEVGFKVEINNNSANAIDERSTKVYDKLFYTPSGSSETLQAAAKDMFGSSAKYFATLCLEGIPSYGFDDIVYARPYWVTADGTKVFGLSRYNHVEDGYKKYANVSINMDVLSGLEAAAGVVEISVPTGFKFIEEETGRIFEEMTAAANAEGTKVKCVGNVQDISKDAKMNDLYINLRFEVDDTAKLGNSNFTITDSTDFCNKDEASVSVDVWDVLY